MRLGSAILSHCAHVRAHGPDARGAQELEHELLHVGTYAVCAPAVVTGAAGGLAGFIAEAAKGSRGIATSSRSRFLWASRIAGLGTRDPTRGAAVSRWGAGHRCSAPHPCPVARTPSPTSSTAPVSPCPRAP